MTEKAENPIENQLRSIRNVGLLSLAVVLVIGGLFYWASSSTDRDLQRQNAELKAAIAQIVEARTEARHTTCARANLVREEAGNAAAEKARDFIRSQRAYTGAPESTGRLKAAEDAYIESQRQVTLNSYPKQDCSAAGVEAFYKNPPIDPYAETCVPDGKGLCK